MYFYVIIILCNLSSLYKELQKAGQIKFKN